MTRKWPCAERNPSKKCWESSTMHMPRSCRWSSRFPRKRFVKPERCRGTGWSMLWMMCSCICIMGINASTAPRSQRFAISCPETPRHKWLTCTHILQTEVKSKMNALNKGLQVKPAFPQGFPARWAIRLAGLIAAHACHLRPEAAPGQSQGGLTSACSDDRQRFGFNSLCGWEIWGRSRQIAQLQQAHGYRRHQSQQADQTIGTLHLSLFDPTARFEALMIVFNRPATARPVGPRPCLFTGSHRDRGEQDPLQGLFAFGGLFFPNPHHPDRHWCQLGEKGIMAGRQWREVDPGQMQQSGTGFALMTGWHVERPLVHRWQNRQFGKQVGEGFLLHLDTPILIGTHDKVRLGLAATVQKLKDIRSTIGHMDQEGRGAQIGRAS